MVADSSKKAYNWKQDALGFGALIYCCNTFVIPLLSDMEITLVAILASIPIHALAAYGYGRTMRWWHKHHPQKEA